MTERDIGRLIEEETEQRLRRMESPDYVFPPRATKRDAVAIVLIIAVCGLLILGCMTGKII